MNMIFGRHPYYNNGQDSMGGYPIHRFHDEMYSRTGESPESRENNPDPLADSGLLRIQGEVEQLNANFRQQSRPKLPNRPIAPPPRPAKPEFQPETEIFDEKDIFNDGIREVVELQDRLNENHEDRNIQFHLKPPNNHNQRHSGNMENPGNLRNSGSGQFSGKKRGGVGHSEAIRFWKKLLSSHHHHRHPWTFY